MLVKKCFQTWSGFLWKNPAPPPPPHPKTATSVWSPQNELALIKYTKMLVLRWGFAWCCSNFVWYRPWYRHFWAIFGQMNAILVLPDWPQNFHNCDRNSDFRSLIVSYHPGLLWHKHGASCVFCNHWRKLNKNTCQIIASLKLKNKFCCSNQIRGVRGLRG